ncbi:MAG TPA: hypothetical protein VKA10_08490 [Prolixibacteraceae bacterium]|nr:hypothetical protein [Prolixibacteraceae bacterium]
MRIRRLLVFILTLFGLQSFAQTNDKIIDLDGYISNMLSYNHIPKGYGSLLGLDATEAQWVSNHYLQNRLNLFVYPAENLRGSVQIRNRLFYGDYIQQIQGYAQTLETDNVIMDLSRNVIDQKNYALNMAIDRFWLQYTIGKLDIKAGRQRINWSQTYAFNPNDIFNTYSFFEVDYPERPGTDALRASYYPTFSSTAEAAVSLDSANRVTAAGLYRFNKWGYDIQFLAGILSEQDFVFGAGWSGNIKGAGFRGEASYFQPKENFSDTTGIFVASVSFDYMFSNSLYIQLEGLYNQMPENGNIDFLQLFNRPLTPKMLSFTEYTLLAAGSYPITPLWGSSISTIYYPKMNAFFLGPSVDYSASDNLTLSLFWQTFSGKFPNPVTQANQSKAFNFGYLRIKYNF